MSDPQIDAFRLDPRAKLPARAMNEAIGYDVHAFLLTEGGRPSKRLISRMNTLVIPTGIVLRPPEGFYLQVCSRSGLAMKGIFVANSPGIVDPDYTGEIKILLFNGGYEAFYVEHEQRIAQIVVAPIVRSILKETQVCPPPTGRGVSGFGSTGT